MSNRANGPFIEVNCAVLHENLIESELFGYEKGAFTGASSSGKIGKIELANHGTLFLDEIGELPAHIQSKLLQLIQEKTIERLSGTQKHRAGLPADRGHQPQSGGGGAAGAVPVGPLLPAERHPGPHPPSAAAARGYPAYGPPVFGAVLQGIRQAAGVKSPVCGLSGAISLARQCASAGKPDGTAGHHRPESDFGHYGPAAGIQQRRQPRRTSPAQEGTLAERMDAFEGQIIRDSYHRCGTTVAVAKELGISQATAVRKIAKYVKVRKE